MADIQGTCQDRFAAVRDALAASLDSQDAGASAAVYLDGEPVVDIWGGHADAARTTPRQRDTITSACSTTKTMTALCALILADRGDPDLAAPVARYWPEFAAAGKLTTAPAGMACLSSAGSALICPVVAAWLNVYVREGTYPGQ